jgi:shikimate kinase
MRRKHIFLTGFMGSGKSTAGPLIAEALGYSFIDLDAEIERHEGESIEEIFRHAGETHFRNLERSYLDRLMSGAETVFALGGGTVTIEGMIPLLRGYGVLVYLSTDADELVVRLRGHTHRPLLTKEGEAMHRDELHRRITTLLQGRETYYRQADIIVETSGQPVEKVVETVLTGFASILHADESRTND